MQMFLVTKLPEHRNALLLVAIAIPLWMLSGQIVEADLDWIVVPYWIGVSCACVVYCLQRSTSGWQRLRANIVQHRSKLLWIALAVPLWMLSGQIVDAELDWIAVPYWAGVVIAYVLYRFTQKKASSPLTVSVPQKKQNTSEKVGNIKTSMWMFLAVTLWIASGCIVDADLDWMVFAAWIAVMVAFVAHRLKVFSMQPAQALKTDSKIAVPDEDLDATLWKDWSNRQLLGSEILIDAPNEDLLATQTEEEIIPQLWQVVEPLKVACHDPNFIVAELRSFLLDQPGNQDISLINELFATLAQQQDSHLVDLIVDILPSMNLEKDQRTFEILLPMHVAKHNFVKAHRLIAEGGIFTARTKVAIMTMALEEDDIEATLQMFADLKDHWDDPSIWGVSPWKVQQHRMQAIFAVLELACQKEKLPQLLPLLEDMQINQEAVDTMLAKCLRTQKEDKEATHTDPEISAIQDVGSRMSSVFQQMSLDFDEDVDFALMPCVERLEEIVKAPIEPYFEVVFEEPVKATKVARRGRRVSFVDESTDEDGSTSAGTSSDSETESVDDWMTKAAWACAPGLEQQCKLDTAGLDLPDLPDPWELVVAN